MEKIDLYTFELDFKPVTYVLGLTRPASFAWYRRNGVWHLCQSYIKEPLSKTPLTFFVKKYILMV
jgi:hypothetical protein